MHIVTQRRVELAYQLADDVQMVEPFSPVRSTVTLFGFTNYLEKKLKNREGPKVLLRRSTVPAMRMASRVSAGRRESMDMQTLQK